MNIPMNTRTDTGVDMDSFLPLLQTFDSLFPIGNFTLSNGMETYTQKEIVNSRVSLEKFLSACLYVLPYNDLGFAAWTFRTKNFVQADSLCAASKTPRELREGSNRLCARFIKAQKEIHSDSAGDLKALLQYENEIRRGKCFGVYPVTLGLYFQDMNADPALALKMYAYSQISAMVNHAVKLIPLGQLEGQKALRFAEEKIGGTVQIAMNVNECELGVGGCGFDFRSMEHERLYSRLYSS